MIFEQADEFKKELKSFLKKWRSLDEDLIKLQHVLPSLYIKTNGIEPSQFREGFFGNKKATVMSSISGSTEVVKARLDCQALGNKNILRVIFMRMDDKILFIEIYSKNEKSREDPGRIEKYKSQLP